MRIMTALTSTSTWTKIYCPLSASYAETFRGSSYHQWKHYLCVVFMVQLRELSAVCSTFSGQSISIYIYKGEFSLTSLHHISMEGRAFADTCRSASAPLRVFFFCVLMRTGLLVISIVLARAFWPVIPKGVQGSSASSSRSDFFDVTRETKPSLRSP